MGFERTIKPEQVIAAEEGQEARRELARLGPVWIGPDMRIEKPVLVPPERVLLGGAKIILNKKDLPEMALTKGALGALNWSMRSFFAQCGIEILFDRECVNEEMLASLSAGHDIAVPVDVFNHGKRAVKIEGNVMRFFWADDNKRLRGTRLFEALKSGEFAVEGEEGKDWFIIGDDVDDQLDLSQEETREGLSIVVRLKSQKLHPAPAPEPIERDEALPIRDQLATILTEVPEGKRFEFEIGETPRITVGPNIVAVIETGTDDDRRRHIRSPLIDAGSDWPIRTETTGQDYVEFRLYSK
jgi:hypothetical protein